MSENFFKKVCKKILFSCFIILTQTVCGICQKINSQLKLGPAFSTNIHTSRSIDYSKYSSAGYTSLSTYALCLSILYEDGFFGIKTSGGVANTSKETAYSFPTYPNGTHSEKSTVSGNYPVIFISPRFNIPGKNLRCFFDFTIGVEFYSDSSDYNTITNPLILKTGFGIQLLNSKHWGLELKAGFGVRNDYRGNEDHKIWIPDFELGFYRIIYSKQ